MRLMSSLIPLQEISLQAKLATLQREYRELIPSRNAAFDPLKLVTAFAAKGDLQSCQSEIFQLELLIKNLSDVRKPRPDVFSSLRSKIYKCGDYSNHVGLRMEARIASSLARKAVGFAYLDAPDFTVNVEGGTAFIECTGVLPADFPQGKPHRVLPPQLRVAFISDSTRGIETSRWRRHQSKPVKLHDDTESDEANAIFARMRSCPTPMAPTPCPRPLPRLGSKRGGR